MLTRLNHIAPASGNPLRESPVTGDGINAFAEIIHFHIVEEIRLFLKEREIQADLDFSILRGDRQEALNQGKDSGRNNEPRVRLRSRRHQ